LQPTPDGKAIWRATVTSSTGWSYSFTLLRLAPALIWELGERPAPFAGAVAIDTTPADKEADVSVPTPAIAAMPPAEDQQPAPWEDAGGTAATVHPPAAEAVPDAMEDMLAMVGMGDFPAVRQDAEAASVKASVVGPETPALPLAKPLPPSPAPKAVQPSGEHFMAWLQQGVASRRLIINDAKALVHTVSDTAYLVSPGVFQRYAQEHPQIGMLAKQANLQDWQWVLKRFEQLQLHRKHTNGLNIWTCDVTGRRKSRRLHGYLLQNPAGLFDQLPPNNPYLSVQP
jgi:hypothetical protein